jgi:hypothetical protein
VLPAVRKLAWVVLVGSSGVAFQDHALRGYEVKEPYSLIVYGGILLALAVLLFTTEPIRRRLARRPRLKTDGVGQFSRTTKVSRGDNDLQILYAVVLNDRDGGKFATAEEAEIWIEAFDMSGTRIGGAAGNWYDLSAGKPDPVPRKKVTLKPTRQPYALEVMGKFVWDHNAWIPGESDPPSLKPGTYRMRALVSYPGAKARRFEWIVHNPGAGAELAFGSPDHRKEGLLIPSPVTATVRASVSEAGFTPSISDSDSARQEFREIGTPHEALKRAVEAYQRIVEDDSEHTKGIGAAIAEYEAEKSRRAGMARAAIIQQLAKPGPFSSFEVEKPWYHYTPERREFLVIVGLSFTNPQMDRKVILDATLMWETKTTDASVEGPNRFLPAEGVHARDLLEPPIEVPRETLVQGTLFFRSFAEPFVVDFDRPSLRPGTRLFLRLTDRISGQKRDVPLDERPL